MKKVISFLVISIILLSCENPSKTEYQAINKDLGVDQMVRVRGCEYIKSHVYLGSVYTHAGDCDNSIHKTK